MNTSIVFKTIMNGITSWLVIALIVSMVKDMTYAQAFAEPMTIVMALSSTVGGYIGFQRRARKHRQA